MASLTSGDEPQRCRPPIQVHASTVPGRLSFLFFAPKGFHEDGRGLEPDVPWISTIQFSRFA